MNSLIILSIVATHVGWMPTVSAAPAPVPDIWDAVDWTKVDYSSVDWTKVDWSKVDYSHVDWSEVDYSHIDWSKVDYSDVNWDKVDYDNKGDCEWKSASSRFTSTYRVSATPEQVINGTGAAAKYTGGLSGASATFKFGIISSTNTICYHISVRGFRGEYQSPAKTATHIHEGPSGASGPPRLAFPDPVPEKAHKPEGRRVSVGCMTGPFTTGVLANGVDTATGFHVSQIENNPQAFYADIHSSLAVPGAVRGQLEY
ncbi:hypothetical protein BX600DRAFT_435949 [Xylariales sp. PMI_506]|nr:hypothetical protein BX600DRAFT_435949 [Xylariales sp. PMI_506]